MTITKTFSFWISSSPKRGKNTKQDESAVSLLKHRFMALSGRPNYSDVIPILLICCGTLTLYIVSITTISLSINKPAYRLCKLRCYIMWLWENKVKYRTFKIIKWINIANMVIFSSRAVVYGQALKYLQVFEHIRYYLCHNHAAFMPLLNSKRTGDPL